MSTIITVEELAKVDPGISVVCDVQNTLVNITLLKWANDEQKKKYFPLLSTKWVGCFCLSEWGSGSDAFAMKTKAVPNDVRYSHFSLGSSWRSLYFEWNKSLDHQLKRS
jgi:short/branched chain acyl-CoA dehydrogenase